MMLRTLFARLLCLPLLALAATSVYAAPADRAQQPNIVWIIAEDMSAHFGCYGETTVATPHVDALAAGGVQFTRAFTTAPVCSTSRSALITGMYQTSIGAHHHRSGRGTEKIYLPEHVQIVPAMFRQAGYWTCNGTVAGLGAKRPAKGSGIAKTDYNFEHDLSAIYDGGDWAGRAEGQPFFAQVQLSGGKGRTTNTPKPIDPADVKLPPYYPYDPVIVDDWAEYMNAVMNTDLAVGRVVERLKQEGEYDNTYIFFITDHGISHARGKQFCYDEGIHIPLVVHGPGLKAGTRRDDLVLQIDLAATSLGLAGIEVPDYMQARDILASQYEPRKYVVSARDRCDETTERIRSVRTERFKYIRNYHHERPYLQPNAYKDGKAILQAMRRLHAAGKLNRDQSLIMASTRPPEELYDLAADPHELHNLADDPAYAEVLAELRGNLETWIEQTGDQGQRPESEAMYDSDMAVYLTQRGGTKDPARRKITEDNIALMKKWAAEGK